jgi:hypothetical protein
MGCGASAPQGGVGKAQGAPAPGAISTYDNAPALSKPVARSKQAAAPSKQLDQLDQLDQRQALTTLLDQLTTLPTRLGQPAQEAATTLRLLFLTLQAPTQHAPTDLAPLVTPLLLAAQRCAGHQLTMRLAFLLVSDRTSAAPACEARPLRPHHAR